MLYWGCPWRNMLNAALWCILDTSVIDVKCCSVVHFGHIRDRFLHSFVRYWKMKNCKIGVEWCDIKYDKTISVGHTAMASGSTRDEPLASSSQGTPGQVCPGRWPAAAASKWYRHCTPTRPRPHLPIRSPQARQTHTETMETTGRVRTLLYLSAHPILATAISSIFSFCLFVCLLGVRVEWDRGNATWSGAAKGDRDRDSSDGPDLCSSPYQSVTWGGDEEGWSR